MKLNYDATGYGGGSDIGSYLRVQDPNSYVNPSTVATSAEAQRYNALNRLAGNKMPTLKLSADTAATATRRSIFDASSIEAELTRQVQAGKSRAAQAAENQRQIDAINKMNADGAKRSKTGTIIGLIGLGFSIFSDKKLKTNIKELSGDQVSSVLANLTKGK